MTGTLATALATLADYLLLALPGLILLGIAFWLARPERDPWLRIVVLMLGFVLVRDAMTPAGLWEFGLVDGVAPWLRMTDDPVVLVAIGLGSLALVAAMLRDPDLWGLVWWGRVDVATVALGLGGGALAAAPVLALSLGQPLAERGGVVAPEVLPALAFMALAGNLGEEVIFRGFLQGRLEQAMSGLRAALASGVLFAACHTFLATTVTDVGWPLLAFTLWEGLICALLRWRRGVIPAAIAHGVAIFLLASGLL